MSDPQEGASESSAEPVGLGTGPAGDFKGVTLSGALALLLCLPLLASCPRRSVSASSGSTSGSSGPVSAPTEPSQTASAVASSQPEPAEEGGLAADKRCPEEMTLVGATCIDRWEAHLVIVSSKGKETRHPYYEPPPEQGIFKAVSAPGKFPQAYLDRYQAQRACRAASKRLCTVKEWYTACRGSADTQWPYGDEEIPGLCNTHKPHLLSKMFGEDNRAWDPLEHLNSPLLNKEPGFLNKTGALPRCKADNGTYDMVGNLHEWVSDEVDRTLADKMPISDGLKKNLGAPAGYAIFLGGFYSSTNQYGRGCGYLTVGHKPRYHDYSIGFRCCQEAAIE